MKITIERDDQDDIIFDNVQEFAITGTMAGPTVQIPVFSYSLIHDADILSCLCEALKIKIRRHGESTSK